MPWYLLSQPYLPRHQPPGHNVQVSSNASAGSNVPNTLLMTCQVQIQAPDSTSVKARALLDSGSTMSFVSERIVQSLGLRLTVSGIGGMSTKSSQSSFPFSKFPHCIRLKSNTRLRPPSYHASHVTSLYS